MSALVLGGILRVTRPLASMRQALSRYSDLRFGMLWFGLLIGTGASSPVWGQSITEHDDGHMPTYVWDFGRSSDRNLDQWPDDWRRKRGPGYPAYVNVAIEGRDRNLEDQLQQIDRTVIHFWTGMRQLLFSSLPELPPSIVDALVDRYLRIDLDGGQFSAQTPVLPASRRYQYAFSCQVRTQRLRHDTALAELVFLDEAGRELETHASSAVGGTTPWTELSVGPVQPPLASSGMTVRLKVQRSDDGLEDIHGTIGFDNIRVEQLPQLHLTTDRSLGVYQTDDPVVATARVLGFHTRSSEIQFQVFNTDGAQVAAATRIIEATDPDEGLDPDDALVAVGHDVVWRIPQLEPGYYQVRASLKSHRTAALMGDTTFAIVDDLVPGIPHGCFGWTLSAGSLNASSRDFATWLGVSGVAWVKYPCWLAPDDTAGAEFVAELLAKIQDSGIETVGLLDVPPESQLPAYELRNRREMVASQLFRDVNTWQPLLEPMMSRITLKVRRWQLGGDRDHSFLGRPRLRETIATISTGLQGFGQPIDVAISWPWMESQLLPEEASWQSVCRSSDPPLSARELDAFLEYSGKDERPNSPRTWLLLDPISAETYDRDTRIADLVLRMAAVRGHRVQAAFASRPMDPNHGILRDDGRPSDLYLPWRTTSRLIGNLRRVGALQLRSGARNLVLANRDRAVLMVWSASPTKERIFLGADAKVVDVWGKSTKLPIEVEEDQPIQQIEIGPTPVFVIGVNPTLLALRMSVNVEPDYLDSILGEQQQLSISLTNPSDDSMIGAMRVRPPETWAIQDPQWKWELLGGRSADHAYEVTLGNATKIGEYELPIQFEVDGTPPHRITVYRKIHVGPQGVELKATTRLLNNGELEVVVELVNRTDAERSYDCILFPPSGRQYERRFLTVRAHETVRRGFFLPDAEDLVGQSMVLRAIEQEGRRILNYEIRVRP